MSCQAVAPHQAARQGHRLPVRLPELPQAELMTPHPRGARLKVLPMTIFHLLAQICIMEPSLMQLSCQECET